MGVISGVKAAINGIPCLKEWRLSTTNDLATAYCSASGGAPIVGAGNEDWSCVAFGYGVEPPVLPGDTFQFTGALRNGYQTDSGANGAIVTKVIVHFPVASGKYFWYELHFASANSTLVAGTGTIEDVSTPAPVSPVGMYLHFDDVGVPIINAKLTVENAVATYRDSSTGGDMGRKEGNYYCTWEADVYFDEFGTAEVPAAGSSADLKFFVTDTTFWHVDIGVVRQRLRRVPIEGNEETNQAEMCVLRVSGDWNSNVSGGTIITPGLVTIWP